jgi:hypothetical protein
VNQALVPTVNTSKDCCAVAAAMVDSSWFKGEEESVTRILEPRHQFVLPHLPSNQLRERHNWPPTQIEIKGSHSFCMCCQKLVTHWNKR